MTVQYPQPCKFELKHGKFANPRELARHYDEHHADEHPPSQVRLAVQSLKHARAGADEVAKPEVQMVPTAIEDIVVPIVTALANGGPVTEAQMRAVFAWRDATSVLLEAFR
jgi:hypothetical protein